MRKIILMVLMLAGVAGAQTLSPLTTDCGKKCEGTFQVQNNTLQPLSAVVETYSVVLDKDGQHFNPLLPSTHVKLSETSARLGPKETREFEFKIKCDVEPCNTVFLVGMVMGHTKGDKDHPAMIVRVILPHVVYGCEKAKDCRLRTIEASGYKIPPLTASTDSPK